MAGRREGWKGPRGHQTKGCGPILISINVRRRSISAVPATCERVMTFQGDGIWGVVGGNGAALGARGGSLSRGIYDRGKGAGHKSATEPRYPPLLNRPPISLPAAGPSPSNPPPFH